MKTNAYAKVNLTLDVLDRRDDGYHNIDSVMQKISLCDVLEVKRANEINVSCNIEELIGKNNIVYKAAEEFFGYTGIFKGADISINKNIPCAAGLGGGSADAAAVIRALDVIYETHLSDESLCEIGIRIGADVPFCLISGTARIGGIGEKIEKIKPITGFGVLIIKNGSKKSTAEMYRMIDRVKERKPMSQKFIDALNSGNSPFDFTGNDFLYTEDRCDTIEKIKQTQPICVSLSGSGPSLFAVYKDTDDAKRAAELLHKYGFSPIVSEFI